MAVLGFEPSEHYGGNQVKIAGSVVLVILAAVLVPGGLRLAKSAAQPKLGQPRPKAVIPTTESRYEHALVVEDGKGGRYEKVGELWHHFSAGCVLLKKMTPLEVTNEIVSEAEAERAAFDEQMSDNGPACLL